MKTGKLQAGEYDFGKLSKSDALNMWQCDINTGELKKVKLNKRLVGELTPKGMSIYVRHYSIQSKPNLFFLPAKNVQDAKEKFEAEFAKVDAKLKELEYKKLEIKQK